MATDYDERRDREAIEADQAESLEALKATPTPTDDVTGVDEANLLENLELPGADLSNQSLTVTVIPIQADEFRCDSCFLVVHASRRAEPGRNICTDCA